ncbi:MAG TPA: ATP-binding protein, partial [Phaeodactylibacter sp.]|nr:ATP-binding protein [Phaeodactylibacter sp.]
RNQKNIELLVVDNGEGMPQEILQEIQAGKFNNKITKNGYGLGLSICHSLTTTLGGKMMVESKVHQGTQIALTFPVLDKKTSSKIEQNCLRASGMSSEPVVFFPINLKENTTAS